MKNFWVIDWKRNRTSTQQIIGCKRSWDQRILRFLNQSATSIIQSHLELPTLCIRRNREMRRSTCILKAQPSNLITKWSESALLRRELPATGDVREECIGFKTTVSGPFGVAGRGSNINASSLSFRSSGRIRNTDSISMPQWVSAARTGSETRLFMFDDRISRCSMWLQYTYSLFENDLWERRSELVLFVGFE